MIFIINYVIYLQCPSNIFSGRVPHVQGVRLNHTILAREERPARL
jgi:hypothetical protein